MKEEAIDRVVFYSDRDWSINSALGRIEFLLNSIDLDSNFQINDVIEFYNIKKFFDADITSTKWNDAQIDNYRKTTEQLWQTVRQFFLRINSNDINTYIENLNYSYQNHFWELISYFQVYKNITKEAYDKVLQNFPFQIRNILLFEKIVKHFAIETRAFLLSNHESAELLLSTSEQSYKSEPPKYFFPKCLSLKDKEDIILNYISSERPNINYISLILNLRDSDFLKISPQTKLKVMRKEEALSDEIFNRGHSQKYGIEVCLHKEQTEPLEFSQTDNVSKFSYSLKFLESIPDSFELFLLFRYLFLYLDDKGLITLINKKSEGGIMEELLMKSINQYPIGTVFHRKDQVSFAQLRIFDIFLRRRESSIEQLIKHITEEVFNKGLKLNLQKFKTPSDISTHLEKVRLIVPELELLLNQFQLFVNYGEIDQGLIPHLPALNFSDVKSLASKKYIYSEDAEVNKLKYFFFSDQSPIHYVEPFRSKYRNLYDLLINEDVTYDNFADYQREIIDKLINDAHLQVDKNGFVRFQNPTYFRIVNELHKNEVISYWYYSKTERDLIDKMLENGSFFSESTLFTKSEISYLNYLLNKKQFTNGLDLRNKYAHGSNSDSENVQENEYFILLRTIVLVFLKILDDLAISDWVKSQR